MTLLLVLACASAPMSQAPVGSTPDVPTPTPAPAPEPTGAPDPLAGKTLSEICTSDLLLLKWEYDDLQRNFAARCCVEGGIEDEGWCDLDWPFSDVPDCGAYDQMRNAIFAYYGYRFSKPEYQEMFEKQPWYRARDDFDADWLNPVAKKNVDTLKRLRAEKVACMEYPAE
ncbi:MAG: YARHG domain-containing protein [Alphaproteobacteria bacterium]|nr:YARHG domain-containing protein [Alphaproteobacteria bacterium]